MTGDEKRGDAVADKWRDQFEKHRRETELELTKLDIRAEQRSAGEEEISEVIHREALERQRAKGSEPPSGTTGKIAVTFVRAVKGWPQALVALGVLGLVAWWLFLRYR